MGYFLYVLLLGHLIAFLQVLVYAPDQPGLFARITSFFDRDSRDDWTSVSGGVAGFFLDFLMNPGQDLAKLQQQIQNFWDALPPFGG